MPALIYQHLNKWHYWLVLFLGAASVLAFAPFKLYPVAWITPAILFYLLTKAKTKKQYFNLGFIFGVGFFGAGASWPFVSMYHFAHAPLIVSIVGTALFVLMLAVLTTGLFGLLASLFRHKPVYSRLLLFYPAAWVLLEWWRSWFLTGFPWLYFGNTQIDTVFSAYAPVFGVLGVSWASVLVSGAILSFKYQDFPQASEFETPEFFPFGNRFKLSYRIISVLVIALIILFAFTLSKIEWTQKSGDPISVSVLQSNISQQDKLNPEKFEASLKLYKDMTERSRDSDLIVWPETGLFDAFGNHMDSLILPLQQSLASNKAILIGGFFVNEKNTAENSVLAISSENRKIYSKRHLVPFGEYIPLLEYIRWMGDWIPYSNIAAGDNDGTLPVAGEIAQMTICYEDAFGSEMIKSLPRASLLINITHDGWFTGSLEPQQHMQIARMRSLEMGRYMIRATTTGPAGIINEKGKVVVTAPIYTRKIISGQVQPLSGTTPYVRWGNWLIVSILLAILLLGLLRKRD